MIGEDESPERMLTFFRVSVSKETWALAEAVKMRENIKKKRSDKIALDFFG